MSRVGFLPEWEEKRELVKDFVNNTVIPAEAELEGDRRGTRMQELKAEAKERGIWALGHPKEIGGGGMPQVSSRRAGRRSSVPSGKTSKKTAWGARYCAVAIAFACSTIPTSAIVMRSWCSAST